MINYVTRLLFRGRCGAKPRKQPVLIYAAVTGRSVSAVLMEQLTTPRRHGYRVMLMCAMDDETHDRAIDHGVEVIPLPARRAFGLPQGIRNLLFAISTFRRIRPELVSVVAADAALVIGLAGWVSGVPTRVREPALRRTPEVVVPEQRARRRRRGAVCDVPPVRRQR